MMRPLDALSHWGIGGPLAPVEEGGLVNRTWLVGRPARAVLQRVNPVFPPEVHLDIAAVVERLAERGLRAPRLLPARDGRLWVEDEGGWTWRLQEYVPGRTVHRVERPEQAAEAGAMLGRFHGALAGWDHEFRTPDRRAHDTPARMAELRAALEEADGHPLAVPAREVGEAILAAWDRWEGEIELPRRICHGDPKISNVRFDSSGERALCLIDLDTVGPLEVVCELGDAWRSWCNPAREDDLDAVRFDVELFRASATAYLEHAPPLTARERVNLVGGVERICLELAARFCADAVRNRYFREDRKRFPQPGAHNLLRARAQLRLARSAREHRTDCLAVVVRPPRPRGR